MPKSPVETPLSWMVADINGAVRDLAWYINEAEQSGDREAALRAIQLVVESLQPAALAQSGSRLPSTLVDAILRILGPAAASGESEVLRVARRDPKSKVENFNRMWFWCFRMHELLEANPDLSQEKAAEVVMEESDGNVPDAATVAKNYRHLRKSIIAFNADSASY